MQNSLNITITHLGDLYLLRLHGVLDFYSASILKAEFARNQPATGASMILDLSSLEYMDSAGIGSLVFLNAQTKKLGAQLMFANISTGVAQVMKISGIGRMFRILSAEEYFEASKALQAIGDGR